MSSESDQTTPVAAEATDASNATDAQKKAAKAKAKRDRQKQKKRMQQTSSSSSSSSSDQQAPIEDDESKWAKAPVLDHEAIKDVQRTLTRETTPDHPFWTTQPVIQIGDEAKEYNGPIDRPKTVSEIQSEPYALKGGLQWVETNLDDPVVLEEVYQLLTNNYVEDDDNMFRFDYSKDFLLWSLKPPGYRKQWHIGVSYKSKLVAFITAIPAHAHTYDKFIKLVEINFLCVSKNLRSKRLAPVLIKEITRRVNLTDIWQAVYTAGRVLPSPVSIARYYHRSLNPKKLIAVGFSHLAPRMNLARTIKLYKLPETTQVAGFRPMRREDVPAAWALLTTYLSSFKLAPHFSEAEFAHWFVTRENVVYSFVVQDPATGTITDFTSFYALPSTIIGNPTYSSLRVCYSFYNVASKTSWPALMNDTLICAKNLEFDVFNALDIMENEKFIKELKFGVGDGRLHYYLYNWSCPAMLPKDLGLVLM